MASTQWQADADHRAEVAAQREQMEAEQGKQRREVSRLQDELRALERRNADLVAEVKAARAAAEDDRARTARELQRISQTGQGELEFQRGEHARAQDALIHQHELERGELQSRLEGAQRATEAARDMAAQAKQSMLAELARAREVAARALTQEQARAEAATEQLRRSLQEAEMAHHRELAGLMDDQTEQQARHAQELRELTAQHAADDASMAGALRDSREQHTADVRAQQEHIAELKSELAVAEDNAASLNKAVEENHTRIVELQEAFDAELSVLQEAMAADSERHQEELAHADAELEALQAALERAAEQHMTALERATAQQQRHTLSHEARVAQMLADISGKDEQLAELRAGLEASRAELEASRGHLDAERAQLYAEREQALSASHTQDERTLAALEAAMGLHPPQAQTHAQRLTACLAAIARKDEQLEAAAADIRGLEDELDEKHQTHVQHLAQQEQLHREELGLQDEKAQVRWPPRMHTCMHACTNATHADGTR